MGIQATPRARSAVELKSIIETKRTGLWRDMSGVQQILKLAELDRITVGRRSISEVVLCDDDEVSRTHAELELVGGDWAVTDDGLSRNGTYVNGARIVGRKRLADGDALRLGKSVVEYRCPSDGSTTLTAAASFLAKVASLSDTQRRVLIALCRGPRSGEAYATPASNNQIASEVFLGLDAVKNRLRLLFQRFEIGDLPRNQVRDELEELSMADGGNDFHGRRQPRQRAPAMTILSTFLSTSKLSK